MLWPFNGHRAEREKVNGSKLQKVYIDLPSISHEAQLDFLFFTSRPPRSFNQAVSRITLADRLLAPFRASFNHHVHCRASRASWTRLAYPKTTWPSSLTTSASLAICGRGACEVGGDRGLRWRASWRASGSLSFTSIIFMANTSTSVPRDHPAGLFADVGLARELWQGAERGRRRQGAWLACVSARKQHLLISILNPMQAQARPETARLGSLLTSTLLANFGRGPSEDDGGRELRRRAFRRASADALLEPLQEVSRMTRAASAYLHTIAVLTPLAPLSKLLILIPVLAENQKPGLLLLQQVLCWVHSGPLRSSRSRSRSRSLFLSRLADGQCKRPRTPRPPGWVLC